MGQITQSLLETMNIPWAWFPDSEEQVEASLQAAVAHMDSSGRPYALVMKKGMVAAHSLGQTPRFDSGKDNAPADKAIGLSAPPSRHQVLQQLVASTDVENTVLIASTGFNGRELYAIADRPNQLYMVGSMGCAASLGLGLAVVRPDKKVIVIDGDGASLMRMGNLATVGAYAGENYYHLLLDNHVHESTGGQATVSGAIDFQAIASACGYRSVQRLTRETSLASFLDAKAPALMHIKTCRGVPDGLPRPSIAPRDVARRLMKSLGVNTRWMTAV